LYGSHRPAALALGRSLPQDSATTFLGDGGGGGRGGGRVGVTGRLFVLAQTRLQAQSVCPHVCDADASDACCCADTTAPAPNKGKRVAQTPQKTHARTPALGRRGFRPKRARPSSAPRRRRRRCIWMGLALLLLPLLLLLQWWHAGLLGGGAKRCCGDRRRQCLRQRWASRAFATKIWEKRVFAVINSINECCSL
jgi:hypothetical protein